MRIGGWIAALSFALLTDANAQEPTAVAGGDRLAAMEKRVEEQQKLIEALVAEVRALKTRQAGPVAAAAGDAEVARLRRAGSEESGRDPVSLPERVARLEKESVEAAARLKRSDGFQFNAGDGVFEGYVGGRLLTHVRNIFDRPDDGGRTNPNTFFVRQARLEAGGSFFKDYEFKVQADFPTGAPTDSGTLQDGYLGWKHVPWASLRVGQFKEPFSQEETTSTRFLDFVERSVVNRLSPGRDIGIAVYGVLFEEVLEYEIGVFNGQGRAVVDSNEEKDFAGRIRVSPFLHSEEELLQGLRVGLAGTVGDVDHAGSGPLDFRTTELGVLFLDSTVGSVDGTRTRLGVEFSWLYRNVSLRGEWVTREDHVEVNGAGVKDEEVDIDGWYVAGTWIVTGEKKTLENRVKPAEPFDPSKGQWGAFELAFRMASLEVDEEVFDLGVAAREGNSNEVTTYTFGVNWWMTKNFRFMNDFVVEDYADELTHGTHREDALYGIHSRFQIDF